MLICAGVICASPLIPFDTVAFWDVPRLVPYCWRSVRRGGTQVASDSFPVGFKLFPVQVSANCGHQELVGRTSCQCHLRHGETPAGRVRKPVSRTLTSGTLGMPAMT